MATSHYNLKFNYLPEFKYCHVDTSKEQNILAEFLMIWGQNPDEILNTLIPQINFGLKYGTPERYCKYKDVEGLEEKMKKRWEESNHDGKSEFVNINETWEKISEYTGYYIEELDFWLEGIGADICGIAFVTSEKTIIDGNDIGDEPIELPSKDFKEIVIEWLAFILRHKEILPKR